MGAPFLPGFGKSGRARKHSVILSEGGVGSLAPSDGGKDCGDGDAEGGADLVDFLDKKKERDAAIAAVGVRTSE
jgi:hypothetical protein